MIKAKTNQKNIIAIGDFVSYNDDLQITEIEKRKTILQRMDPLNPRKRHILGANIDQVYITFAIKSPDIDIAMMDRYILAAKKGNLTPIVVINKIDLAEDRELVDHLVSIYKAIGIKVFAISAETGLGMKELIKSLNGKTSIFSGPSGVGKTSLINIIAKKDLEVGDISSKIQKGRHTTTYSSLIPLDEETFIIDTPGIASFSLFDVDVNEALEYFSDLNKPLGECKFRSCTHTHEPKCKVKEAEEKNLISLVRLTSYREILEKIQSKEPIYK
ncbi:MAG: Small ribosomal subunit biogenesis GTPase RsgA [Chlamydiia bacterium]|nr:Small ribosomal subunit biogenesis GTPase RsgA [Chlamydiia bacterium]